MVLETIKIHNRSLVLSLNFIWKKNKISEDKPFYIEGTVYASIGHANNMWLNLTEITTRNNNGSLFNWISTTPVPIYTMYFSEKSLEKLDASVLFIPEVNLFTLLTSSVNSNETALFNMYDAVNSATIDYLVSKLDMLIQPLTCEEALDWQAVNFVNSKDLKSKQHLFTTSINTDSSSTYMFMDSAIAKLSKQDLPDEVAINSELMELYSSLDIVKSIDSAALVPNTSTKIGSNLDLNSIMCSYTNTRTSMKAKDFVKIKGFNI
jgi:hypothetical protein